MRLFFFTWMAIGTYSFSASASGYTASPATGTITVSGADVAQLITFTLIPPSTYSVTFAESGLPAGTRWSVTQNGVTMSSATGSIVFTEPNGSYAFTVGSVSGYTASPSSGTVAVSGAAVNEAITFTAVAPGT